MLQMYEKTEPGLEDLAQKLETFSDECRKSHSLSPESKSRLESLLPAIMKQFQQYLNAEDKKSYEDFLDDACGVFEAIDPETLKAIKL